LKIIKEGNAIKEPVVLTIGSFDGVHRGHRELINQLKDIAQDHDLKTAVMSFVPHPKIYFNPTGDFKLLTDLDEKIELLEDTGIDYLILKDFNRDFASQSPEDFIRKLKENYNMQILLMGYDHHFGKDKSGDYKYVKSLEPKLGFKTELINPVLFDGKPISSSRIRNLIKQGRVEEANQLLGYPFFLQGKVVSGNRIGNKLGFPTANINISNPYKILPKQGVYIVSSPIDGQTYYGMMNLGVRPTIDGKKQIMEVHFFDFDKDIYGKNLKMSFLAPLRSEKKFPSLEALTQQLQKDKEASLKWLEKRR
jgi:riboflavin kinase/FMN adenylyltransferase